MTVLARLQSFEIDDDPDRLDLSVLHAYLTKSYWARGITRDKIAGFVPGSWNFGVYHGKDEQVGYARLITDRATFAYLSDVFILPTYQGFGLGKWLMSVVLSQPDVQDMRRVLLATEDAHEFYRRFGFGAIPQPNRLMQWLRPPPE